MINSQRKRDGKLELKQVFAAGAIALSVAAVIKPDRSLPHEPIEAPSPHVSFPFGTPQVTGQGFQTAQILGAFLDATIVVALDNAQRPTILVESRKRGQRIELGSPPRQIASVPTTREFWRRS